MPRSLSRCSAPEGSISRRPRFSAWWARRKKTFTTSLARWFERNGLGSFTPEDAVALFNRWTEGTEYDYAGMLNPGVAETLEALRDRGVRLALAIFISYG